MSDPHMNLRGLDSKSRPDVEIRKANYATLASFMNADPDEIGKYLLSRRASAKTDKARCSIRHVHNGFVANIDQLFATMPQYRFRNDRVGPLS